MMVTIVFCRLTQKGPCGTTVNNDIDDDSATKHSNSHNRRLSLHHDCLVSSRNLARELVPLAQLIVNPVALCVEDGDSS